jgi:Phytanoyl-CoA dioxygenase (PhyH)
MGDGIDALDAIETLTRANKQRRDPAVEARLVTLRHEAFAAVAAARDTRPVWPEPVDLFPDDPRPPEVGVGELTVETVRSAISHHGSLLVRGLLAPTDVARLTDDVDRAFEGKAAQESAPSQTSPWYERFPTAESLQIERWSVETYGGVLAADSPRTLFDLIAAYEAAPIGAIVAAYLGERPALSVKKTTLRRAAARTGTDWWHQDGSFLGRVGSLNVWLSLSHCGEDSPSLDIVGRRVTDILETGTEGADLDWSIGQPVVDRAAQGAIVRPVFRPGDALLFDELLVHRTGTNPSMTGTRTAIESWFFAPSAFPDQQGIPLIF